MGNIFQESFEKENPEIVEIKPLTTERKYPKKKLIYNLKCPKCKNPIEPEFQLCRKFIICRKCYNKIMEEQKEDLLDYFSRLKFEASEILEDKLYLGNEGSSFSKKKLKKRGITDIIIVGYNLYKFYPEDFNYKQIEIDDNEHEEILKYFIPIILYILNNEDKVFFIHCQAGISRSASIVISIIMFIKKLNFEEAFKFVSNKRKIISPNFGFIQQLKEFQEMLELIDYKFKFLQPMQNIIFEDNDF
jgi:protein-tyrosine phosphatase